MELKQIHPNINDRLAGFAYGSYFFVHFISKGTVCVFITDMGIYVLSNIYPMKGRENGIVIWNSEGGSLISEFSYSWIMCVDEYQSIDSAFRGLYYLGTEEYIII